MRDRPQQTYWPIIASQFGTKLSDATFRYNWTAAWKQAMKDDMMHVTQDHYDEDQQFLLRFCDIILKSTAQFLHSIYNIFLMRFLRLRVDTC